MNINRTRYGDNITLALTGRLDTATAPELLEAIVYEFRSAKQITLDFAGLDYVSSAGLRVLLMGEITAKSKKGKQVLINVSAEVMELFETTGFSGVLHFNV
jgi:anti-anti-sigma factor